MSYPHAYATSIQTNISSDPKTSSGCFTLNLKKLWRKMDSLDELQAFFNTLPPAASVLTQSWHVTMRVRKLHCISQPVIHQWQEENKLIPSHNWKHFLLQPVTSGGAVMLASMLTTLLRLYIKYGLFLRTIKFLIMLIGLRWSYLRVWFINNVLVLLTNLRTRTGHANVMRSGNLPFICFHFWNQN